MVKTGIYVGSFNPPHLGHIKIINHCLKRHLVDEIYIVPVFKSSKKLALGKHRINMLNTIANEKIKVIDDAIKSNDYFNYDLLNVIKNKYKINNCFIIMGIDNLNSMINWNNYQNILKENNIICINRNKERPLITENITFINELSSISSTIIRENILKNKNKMTNEVYCYIIDNDLYK